MAQHQDIILHHYDPSPFSWKVRALLGLKDMPWHSVIMPDRLPKPDLVPLTGGYRRAPVMQVGADVYLDSALILAELERRVPGHDAAMAPAVNWWADRTFFQVTVVVLFGQIGDRMDPGFAADREQLSGRPFDAAAMKAMATPAQAQWRTHAGWIERALAGSRGEFLSGDAPGIADIAAYMNIWFLAGALRPVADKLLADLPHVARWRSAMAAIGKGSRQEMSGTAALEVARAATPAEAPAHDSHDPLGLSPGDSVTVAADDYGRDRVAGRLVALTPERVVIARETEELGLIHVHAPRIGYVVEPA